MNDRFDIGLKLGKTKSMPGFFKSGLRIANFWSSGIVADVRDEVITHVMSGSSTSWHFLNSHVGMGSSSQCLLGLFKISLCTSTPEIGENSVNSVL